MRCEERAVKVLLGLAAAIALALTGCTAESPRHIGSTPPRAVFGTSGSSLTIDGKPWWPTGLNAYSLGTNWAVNAGCGPQVDLDTYFSRLPRRSLTRVAVVSNMAVNKHTGRLDFSALDAVFAAAERHDQLLIPVLSGQDGHCENEFFKDFTWYAARWRTDTSHGAPMPFAQWLDTAVTRWGDSPAVAGWTPVGEPTPSMCVDGQCDWRTNTCPVDAAAVLRGFFDATGARIRELDPGAVIWDGRVGGSQCGSVGDDYRNVSTSDGIDVLEYHDYEQGGSLPGHEAGDLGQRLDQAHAVNKPLVVAEIGIPAGNCRSLDDRHAGLAEIIRRERGAGAAGALLWAFVPEPRVHDCTLDIGPSDPALELLGS